MRIFAELFWYFRQEWKRYTGAVFLLVLVSLFELVPPMVVGKLVDATVDGSVTPGYLLGLTGGMALLWSIVYWLRVQWRIWLFGAAAQLGSELRNRLFRHFVIQSPRFFNRFRTGDLMARTTSDVKALVATAGEGVLTAADSLLQGISVMVVMSFFISWELTILALLPMPVMAILVNRYGEQLHHRFSASQAAFASLSEQTQTSLNGIRMIRAFGLEKRQQAAFDKAADVAGEHTMSVAEIDARFDPVIYGTIGASFFLSVSGGGYMVAGGQLTLGELTAFTMYQGLMIWPILAIAWLFNILERGSAAWKRIREVLDTEPDIVGGKEDLPSMPATLQIGIDNMTWNGDSEPVLLGIHVTLEPGQMLGIAGPVGSGKSALLASLLRFEDLKEGNITYGGVSVREVDLGTWRGKFAVVSQTPFLFSRTIAENIALGNPDAPAEEVREVARMACIDEDIAHLPDGYGTLVGEKGITLSGGQKQRIAIARALLLNADILILDDALSAVDGRTEHRILENLHTATRKQTVIVIAHRLSALESADEIIVLDKGRVRERGQHRELVARGGWYHDMDKYQQLEAALEEA
ncbi:ABC transporter transmembrane domain-containing protein [Parasalinivibrio latis]|uniref:ABC transporter transmembrane domain-containing protein n=1 Tax=Parasalinivibrio latis TaxID=2952610 RepID=UPI0030E12CFB